MQTKTCTKCGQTKPADQFPTGDSGHPRAACKACHRAYGRAYRTNRDGLIKRRYHKDALGPGQARPAHQPPVITPVEAGALFREITGKRISACFIKRQAFKFPQIADWSVSNNGKSRFRGILPNRWRGFIESRQAVRGGDINDIFGVSED